MRVSVIMPVTRPSDAQRAIDAILGQQTRHAVELLTVGAEPTSTVVVDDLNPAVRRNRAVRQARGEVLAFIDDDAFAAPDWIETAATYLESHPEVVALGGPDPAPGDSPVGALISDTLLATSWIGSGVLCHENRPGIRQVRRPYELALVNLFVRKEAFEGFDESVGYIGEDTALIDRLLRRGKVIYHSGVVVFHRRRLFPLEYLRQRWRYRWKTGWLLANGAGPYVRNVRIWAFLTLPVILVALLMVAPAMAVVLITFYLALSLALGVRATRLPVHWWPVIPFAFVLHHSVYFAATVGGLLSGLVRKRR